jgi:CubicO group peptidase (beta-lactamase class C family)
MFYGDYLQDHIFAPLGMNATRVISDRDIIFNRAAGYEIERGTLKNQEFVSRTFNSTADGALYFNVIDLEKWDRALYGTSLLTKASLDRMWTPFVLNSGKPNSAGYGFAWATDKVNGHKLIEHTGAWQGFTCIITRYVDDKLTVVVLTNLDAGHASPDNMERVVAGLVEPALMPKLHHGIADHNPTIVANLREMMLQTLAGADARKYWAPQAHYVVDKGDAMEMNSNLPKSWDHKSLTLIDRSVDKDLITSTFRIGREGDSKVVTVQTARAGTIHSFAVSADPDNR